MNLGLLRLWGPGEPVPGSRVLRDGRYHSIFLRALKKKSLMYELSATVA